MAWQARDVDPAMVQCSPSVCDAGPPLNRHKVRVCWGFGRRAAYLTARKITPHKWT